MDEETKERLDKIERKINYLILVSSRPDFHKMFVQNYSGWNALSAYEDMMARPEYKDYLK